MANSTRSFPAKEELAASIIGRLAKLSKALGTTLTFEEGKGVYRAP